MHIASCTERKDFFRHGPFLASPTVELPADSRGGCTAGKAGIAARQAVEYQHCCQRIQSRIRQLPPAQWAAVPPATYRETPHGMSLGMAWYMGCSVHGRKPAMSEALKPDKEAQTCGRVPAHLHGLVQGAPQASLCHGRQTGRVFPFPGPSDWWRTESHSHLNLCSVRVE